MTRPHLVALGCLAPSLCVLLAAAPARADDGIVSVGVGVMAAFGGNFLDKPGDKSNPAFGGANDTLYPGFGGTGFGGGLAVDLRFLKIIGLEVDLISKSDRGHGDLTLNNVTYHVDVGQSAWHVPVLAKGVLPLPLLAPFVFLGPEFVFPGSPTATVTSDTSGAPPPPQMTAHVKGYTMFTAGLGFEFKLPIPGIDLRIPFTLRGSLNTSASDHDADRVTYGTGGGGAIRSVDYDTGWKYQALATLGVSYYF